MITIKVTLDRLATSNVVGSSIGGIIGDQLAPAFEHVEANAVAKTQLKEPVGTQHQCH